MGQKTHHSGSRKGEVVKTMKDLLADTFSEMETLRDELQDWMDNIPPNLQGGQKSEELEEAVSQIENVSEVECPKGLEKLEVVWVESTRKRKSRADRRDDCVSALEAAARKLEELDNAEFADMLACVRTAAEEYEAVEFPGLH